jgi:hypothetical protein
MQYTFNTRTQRPAVMKISSPRGTLTVYIADPLVVFLRP